MASVNRQLLLASLINLVLGNESENMKDYSDSVDILKRAPPPETPAALAAEAVDNNRFRGYIITILGAAVFALGIYRVVIYSVCYIRTLTCLNNDTQRYFKMPSLAFSGIKQHLLYAPLFRRRHRQPVSIASVNLGILPSRFQALFLTAVIAMNVVLCVHGIEWHGPKLQKLHHFRNRTGTLALVNMLPLVILAGRNNPLIRLLNISFDTFNLCHRWFGRIVVAETLAHSVAHIYGTIYKSGSQCHPQPKSLLNNYRRIERFPNEPAKHCHIDWCDSKGYVHNHHICKRLHCSRVLLPCWPLYCNRVQLYAMHFTKLFYMYT